MKFLKLMFRDKVDLILLLVIIAISVKNLIGGGELQLINYIFMLYIIGTMVRMAASFNLLNENVTGYNVRTKLKLHPVPGEIIQIKRTTFGAIVHDIFWIGTLSILVIWVLK